MKSKKMSMFKVISMPKVYADGKELEVCKGTDIQYFLLQIPLNIFKIRMSNFAQNAFKWTPSLTATASIMLMYLGTGHYNVQG